MKLKKILNFSLVNCSLHILKISFLIFALIFSVLLPAQDNGFFEKDPCMFSFATFSIPAHRFFDNTSHAPDIFNDKHSSALVVSS